MLKIGVSSCLVGEPVRYDGNHKRSAVVAAYLSSNVELIPVCPEVETGMGVPRPPVHLVCDESGEIRMQVVGRRDVDFTDRMRHFAAKTLGARLKGISGYVFKSRSPSCGISDVPVLYAQTGGVVRKANGLYAHQICLNLSSLPVVDETNLKKLEDVHHFLERATVYQLWHDHGIATQSTLKLFHEQVRAHAMARSEKLAIQLDQIANCEADDSAGRYFAVLIEGLRDRPSNSGHVRAIGHELQRISKHSQGARQQAAACNPEISDKMAADRVQLRKMLHNQAIPNLEASSYLSGYLRELKDSS